ncbi:TPA: NAD(P)/FAD-dependent oxidoreductase, partial [Klebsiella pneumoniae]|nr:NAD(P)/FAD-dependent oxidoreductase [Klebsiella pneumoniae]
PDAAQLAQLAQRGVTVEAEPVLSIGEDQADITLASGRIIRLAGLFIQPRTRLSSPLAVQLGCELEAGATGEFIKVDTMRETNVPGVFACGDAAVAAGNVAIAVGDGARTGTAAHQSLIFR